MENSKLITYWISYAYYVYIFGYASLFKVFQNESMMQGMQSFGFNKAWTIFIGIGELLGVILMIAGLFKPPLKNLGVLLLFPFAVGAFTAHMAHKDYSEFYDALAMCVLTVVLLWTDKTFKVIL